MNRLATKLYTYWLRLAFGFPEFGQRTSVHYSCEVSKADAKCIRLGTDVYVAPHVWFNVNQMPGRPLPEIRIGNGCKIGRRSTISCSRRIQLEPDVLLAPSVLIMDHNHEYRDINTPIHAQNTTEGAVVTIGRNCWLGHGVVIVCGKGELTIGRNCVVGANAVVTRSFPDYCIIIGNPARVVKRYNPGSSKWEAVNE